MTDTFCSDDDSLSSYQEAHESNYCRKVFSVYGNHEKHGMVLDRLRFASHIDNLNSANPVISKFNSVEPKVKYNHIKYTCM